VPGYARVLCGRRSPCSPRPSPTLSRLSCRHFLLLCVCLVCPSLQSNWTPHVPNPLSQLVHLLGYHHDKLLCFGLSILHVSLQAQRGKLMCLSFSLLDSCPMKG
jgi:hypothetical protein